MDKVETLTSSSSVGHGSRGQTRRWLRQHDRILSAAGRLFWQKGYLGTSIDDIAKAANVKKAAIYYYFKSKADMLYEVASKTIHVLMELATPIVDSELPPDKKLEALVTNHIRWQMSHLGISGIGQVERRNLPPKRLRAYINMRDEYEAIFRKVIKEGIAEGKFRPMDPKLASLFILGFTNAIIQWFRPNGSLSSEEISSEAYKFVYHSLKMPKPEAGSSMPRDI